MESLALFAVIVIFLGIVVLTTLTGRGKGSRVGISSAKFPPTFSSSLSQKEVLSVVEARLQAMQSIRFKWKTTEKVEKVGRLQSMLTVPYNLAGDNIRISFLMNLLATKRDAGGCTVEWNYVMMSPLSNTPPEIALLEDEIYKKTTLETRAALFIAQGDEELAEFVQTQAQPTRKEIETPSALEQLTRAATRSEVSLAPRQELFEDSAATKAGLAEDSLSAKVELFEDLLASKVELFEDSAASKAELFEDSLAPQRDLSEDSAAPKIEFSKKLEAPNVNNIPRAPLPDIAGEALKVVAGTTDYKSLMQGSEVQSISLGGTPNPLDFSPPNPALSTGAAAANDAKCVKCSQARDPAFNFCLYCGHAD
jgi:hypothetical protein